MPACRQTGRKNLSYFIFKTDFIRYLISRLQTCFLQAGTGVISYGKAKSSHRAGIFSWVAAI
jgi:hypothetical protein